MILGTGVDGPLKNDPDAPHIRSGTISNTFSNVLTSVEQVGNFLCEVVFLL